MRSDLIRALLGCGNDDLSILDEAEADMYDTVERLKEEGKDISLQSIVEDVFDEGIFRLSEAVKQERKQLEYVARCGQLTNEGKGKLEAIVGLNPQQDFWHCFNFLDTHLFCDSDKKVVYEEWFDQEMQDLKDYTGFNIEG